MSQTPTSEPQASLDETRVRRIVTQFRELVAATTAEVQRSIVGHDVVITRLMMALFLQRHVLLEGVPGLGKTLMLNTLAKCLGLTFKRVQCTPDLMPADIIGARLFDKDSGALTFEKGPVFCNLLLVDEINRATPKTQSALLEAMQECQVTVAGTTHELPRPFMVLATQNPIEMEGTYPLPEAQLDRFLFKLEVPFPDQLELVEIAARTTGGANHEPKQIVASAEELRRWFGVILRVPFARPLLDYCARIILATHPKTGSNAAKKYIRFGAGPRGMQALVLSAKARALLVGRTAVIRDDIIDVAQSCLQHRIILNFDAEHEGLRPGAVVEQVLRELR